MKCEQQEEDEDKNGNLMNVTKYGIKRLNPILFQAKCESCAQSIVSSLQTGGQRLSLEAMNQLAEICSSNSYRLTFDKGCLQYLPSVIVSLIIHQQSKQKLSAALHCLSCITLESSSPSFFKEDFLNILTEIVQEPEVEITQSETHFNFLKLRSSTDPLYIQSQALMLIGNLVNFSVDTASYYLNNGFLSVMFDHIDHVNKYYFLRAINMFLVHVQRLELDLDRFYGVNVSSIDIENSDITRLCLESLPVLFNHKVDYAVSFAKSGAFSLLLNNMLKLQDSVLSVLIEDISLILPSLDSIDICSIRSSLTLDVIRYLCQKLTKKDTVFIYLDVLFKSFPQSVIDSLKNGTFSFLLSMFKKSSFSESLFIVRPIVTGTFLVPNEVTPILIQNDIVSVAGDFLQLTSSDGLLSGLKLIHAMLLAKDDNIQSELRKKMEEKHIAMDVGAIITSGYSPSGDILELFHEINDFLVSGNFQ